MFDPLAVSGFEKEFTVSRDSKLALADVEPSNPETPPMESFRAFRAAR